MSLRGLVLVGVVLLSQALSPVAHAEQAAPTAPQGAGTPATPAVPVTSTGSAHRTRHGRYPMQAADFQHKVEERMLHARERMETRIVRRKLTAERAKEVRGKFEMSVSEVRKVMADAAADGLISRDEARRVNQSTRTLARAAARAR